MPIMRSLGGLLALLAISCTAVAADDAPVGKKIENFRLQDHLGAARDLADWPDAKLVVVAFLGVECPLAKLYGPRLAELAAEYESQGVVFLGVNSNQQDSLTEIAHYAARHKIEFPMLKDPGAAVADQFAAVRTPEVFVLDAERVVRYWGRIDDQYGVGYSRADVNRRHLAAALDELLAGEVVSTPVTESVGCHIGRVNHLAPTGDVTYARQIARILQANCVECHRAGQIAPFALTSHDEVIGWAETIREVIRDQRMPPWHANPDVGEFSNDARLADADRELIYQWIDNGLPLGDEGELPAPAEYDEGWQIPTPDVVYQMPESYTVQAKGTVSYKYFVVDPGFKEDRWIRAAEARPGNRAVVHHLILFHQPPGEKRFAAEAALFNSVAAFAPGMPAVIYPEGLARRIPAGSKLVFQVHYTPNGSEQTDQSNVGLVFADPETVRKETHVGAAIEFRFRIPPGADDYGVEAAHRFNRDMIVYSLLPHMHLRGKSFRFEAQYPDGRREALLDVPRYDFNWQNAYIFAQPKLMPEGTVLHCSARYDNSEENLVNPDPTAFVTWGDQTWEEMMVGTFEGALAEQDLSLGGPQVSLGSEADAEVRFHYRPEEEADSVALAGTFNDWSTTSHPMQGPDAEGRYELQVRLPPGTYEYKYVVNGEVWKTDPGVSDAAGFYHNSILRVGESPK